MKKLMVYAMSLALMLASCSEADVKTRTEEQAEAVNASESAIQARVAPAEYGTYTIQNRLTGKFMEVGGPYEGKYDNLTKMVQFGAPFGNPTWQKWLFNYKFTENGIRYYEIVNHYSGKALDVDAGRKDVNLQLQQWNRNGFAPQLFELRLIAGTDNYYHIINKASGLALTVLNNNTADDVAIVQAPLGQGYNQDWAFQSLPQESYPDDEVIRFFQRNNKSLGSVAWDQGSSIPLKWAPNAGKTLWVTQDAWDGSSFMDDYRFPCNYFFSYSNSIFIHDEKNWNPNDALNLLRPGIDRPKQICDVQPGNTFAWPSNGVEIDNKVYMHCGEGNGLVGTQQSLYVLTESGDRSSWKVERKLIPGLSNQQEVGYAHGMVKEDDGYVYVFGTKVKSYGYANDVYVARFHTSTPFEWEYYNGFIFDKNPHGVPVTEGYGTVSINKVNGKYVMISMDQGFNRCDPEDRKYIFSAWADNPWGPYTQLKKVYEITDRFEDNWARYYTPNIHPQYNNGKNEMLMTYSLNYSACQEDACVDGGIDPDYYRLRAIRIPYSLIGI